MSVASHLARLARPTRRRAACMLGAVVVIATLATLACTKVGTDPTVPVSIQLFAPPSPNVLKGDALRDSTGQPAPLTASVFNSHDEVIADAPIRFLALDSTRKITLDTVSGAVTANDTGRVLVFASVGALQSLPDTIVVVDSPTTVVHADSLDDTLTYTLSPRDTVQSLGVRVLRVVGTDTLPVPRYLVRYAFLAPAGLDNTDSTKVQLVNDLKRPSLADTTDASGGANRPLHIAPFTHPFTDSVVVRATVALPDGTPLPGSPIDFVVHVTIK